MLPLLVSFAFAAEPTPVPLVADHEQIPSGRLYRDPDAAPDTMTVLHERFTIAPRPAAEGARDVDRKSRAGD